MSRDLLELNQEQIETLQQDQVVDWLLANADPHRKQFLILHDGTLVGVDKSQSLRFFPHDSLSWRANAWPMNTRRPVYFYLHRAWQSNTITLLPLDATSYATLLSQTLSERSRDVSAPFLIPHQGKRE